MQRASPRMQQREAAGAAKRACPSSMLQEFLEGAEPNGFMYPRCKVSFITLFNILN
jgi:hypothetical protein